MPVVVKMSLVGVLLLILSSLATFHSFQTFAPAHGTAAHAMWQAALQGNFGMESHNTMAGRSEEAVPGVEGGSPCSVLVSNVLWHLTSNLAVVADLVKPAGYVLEEYTVQTTDGFLLGLYRIPFGQHESAQQARCVVCSSQLCTPGCAHMWNFAELQA